MPQHHGGPTPEIIDRMVRALKLGSWWSGVAKAGGVSERTLRVWRQLGEREGASGPYRDLVDAFEAAEQEGVEFHLANIRRHAMGDPNLDIKSTWQASAWWLERRHGYVARHEITGADGGPIEVAARALDVVDTEIKTLDAELAELPPDPGLRLLP